MSQSFGTENTASSCKPGSSPVDVELDRLTFQRTSGLLTGDSKRRGGVDVDVDDVVASSYVVIYRAIPPPAPCCVLM